MGGAPYLYDAPRRQTGPPSIFNPKAVTMASRAPPPSPKKKPEGPYINFNQHPDGYPMLPYGKTDTKPMSPKTKTAVKVVRWIQFTLRLLLLFGAVGVEICAIFIKSAAETEGYIMRIAPGVDIVFTLYAIYHLLRKPTARPPGSAASYHFFALVMDAGFLPFYVFTALLAKRNLDEDAGASGRWRTFFPTDEESDKVLLSAWLAAVSVAGLHCASLFLDIWLTLIFRKISGLPPDMNPLEDNLTSRRKTKHKHKTSSISAITPLTEKRYSEQSTMSDMTNSQSDPLMTDRGIPSPDRKQMSFMHTRTNSAMKYSPHTPNSAQQSREWLPRPTSGPPLRADLNTRDDLLRRDEPEEQTLAQRREMLAQQAIKRSSRPTSMYSSSPKNTKQEQPPPPPAHAHDPSGDIGLQKERENVGTNYWFVNDEPSASLSQQSPPKPFLFPPKNSGYMTVNAYDDVSDEELEPPMMPEPLRMNPPTPPPPQPLEETSNKANQVAPPQPETPSPIKRTETISTLVSDSTRPFSPSSPSHSPTKARYYGDLKSAQQNILRSTPPPAAPTKTSTPTYPSSVRQYTSNVSPNVKINSTPSPFSLDRKNFPKVKKAAASARPTSSQSPRVVSRSGVDYEGRLYNDDVSDLGTPGRRRDVSGKIAEEGRGGAGSLDRWGMNDQGRVDVYKGGVWRCI
ncbi:hypothetical protein DM02DRAFT_560751 [Periconia macrospinosa]|uniref:Uncharacterized protein n=1 Tax=Periconia macrospinosa TaxID=97972 RepID=A0A2V1DV49_9PLEO|nr:hypothetical protein DM02DRAFT_560751 [Periconia macrospinosa]